MATDWFRSPDWSPAAQEDFERRLARARPYNRWQYLRIKGLALHDAGLPDAARTLWLRILDGEGDDGFERPSVLEHLGDLHKDSDPAEAERYYRMLLAEYPTLTRTTGTAEISLAELLIDKGDQASLEEAGRLLDSWLDREPVKFPNVLFRWHLALIRIAQATGDQETVRRCARTALELAARGPLFPRHKDVGVVRTDDLILQRLRRLAR